MNDFGVLILIRFRMGGRKEGVVSGGRRLEDGGEWCLGSRKGYDGSLVMGREKAAYKCEIDA